MPPLTEEEQRLLLALARRSIEQVLLSQESRQQKSAEFPLPLSASLLVPAGAFVTLRCLGELRGCMGVVVAEKSLYETVQVCAVSAAFSDPRFAPLTTAELPYLQIDVSVLGPIETIAPEHIEIGLHGLLITQGEQRGLLLPQVASERNWDRERFLEETCVKAGLRRDCWRTGATIQAFTAQVFSEAEDNNKVPKRESLNEV